MIDRQSPWIAWEMDRVASSIGVTRLRRSFLAAAVGSAPSSRLDRGGCVGAASISGESSEPSPWRQCDSATGPGNWEQSLCCTFVRGNEGDNAGGIVCQRTKVHNRLSGSSTSNPLVRSFPRPYLWRMNDAAKATAMNARGIINARRRRSLWIHAGVLVPAVAVTFWVGTHSGGQGGILLPMLAYCLTSAFLRRRETCPACAHCISMLPNEGGLQMPELSRSIRMCPYCGEDFSSENDGGSICTLFGNRR